MKIFPHLIACLFFVLTGHLSADEKSNKNPDMRTWTDSKTEKTLVGKITNKNRIGTRVEIKKEDNKYVWIEIARLIKADQDYAHQWVKNDNIITIKNKILAKGGVRTILVRAEAGTKDLVVKTYHGDHPRFYRRTTSRNFKAGEVVEYEREVGKGYTVTGYHSGKQVDQETASSKTGLQIN